MFLSMYLVTLLGNPLNKLSTLISSSTSQCISTFLISACLTSAQSLPLSLGWLWISHS
jgi:hypothetical protein